MSAAAGKKGAGEADLKGMKFEAALDELEKIVDRIDSEDVDLDEAVAAYEKGVALRDHCQKLLDAAQERIRSVKVGPDGAAAGTVPQDPD